MWSELLCLSECCQALIVVEFKQWKTFSLHLRPRQLDDGTRLDGMRVALQAFMHGGYCSQCLLLQQASEKVFAITGATGVMLICYLIPVALHLMARQQELDLGKSSDISGESLLVNLSAQFYIE